MRAHIWNLGCLHLDWREQVAAGFVLSLHEFLPVHDIYCYLDNWHAEELICMIVLKPSSAKEGLLSVLLPEVCAG